MNIRLLYVCLCGLTGAALCTDALAEKRIVGDALAVVRSVEGKYGADLRKIQIEDDIFFDEDILTQADSASKVQFVDGTQLTVGPNSRVTIDAFVYDPDADQNSKMVVNATLGVARFVTGRMGKQAYQIKTPTATIGVRGTVLTLTVEEDGTTSAIVEEGAISVQGQSGEPVEVGEGLSTTTAPGEPAAKPSPAGPAAEANVAEMDVVLLLDGGDQGGNDGITEESLGKLIEEIEQIRAEGCGC